jgi:hypothetical protein
VKNVLKALFVISLAALTTGCKLAVIVVEGGEVLSDRSGTCVAGSVCVVVVEDTLYSDFFEPIAYEGWYFDSWNSGDRFLCGGSINPGCALSFSGVEDKAEVIVKSSETFYLMPIFKPIEPNNITVERRTVTVDGRVWLQPVDFTGYSYDEVEQICPKGVCSGTLPHSSRNLSGYFWASKSDFALLVQSLRKVGAELSNYFFSNLDIPHPIIGMLSDPPEDSKNGDEMFVYYAGTPPIISSRAPEESIGYVGQWFWRPVN